MANEVEYFVVYGCGGVYQFFMIINEFCVRVYYVDVSFGWVS